MKYIIELFNIKIINTISFFRHSLIFNILSKHLDIPIIYEIRGRLDISKFEMMTEKPTKL